MVRAEISQALNDPALVDDELRHLIEALVYSQPLKTAEQVKERFKLACSKPEGIRAISRQGGAVEQSGWNTPSAESGPIFNFYMGKNTPERKDYIMDKLVAPVAE